MPRTQITSKPEISTGTPTTFYGVNVQADALSKQKAWYYPRETD